MIRVEFIPGAEVEGQSVYRDYTLQFVPAHRRSDFFNASCGKLTLEFDPERRLIRALDLYAPRMRWQRSPQRLERQGPQGALRVRSPVGEDGRAAAEAQGVIEILFDDSKNVLISLVPVRAMLWYELAPSLVAGVDASGIVGEFLMREVEGLG